MLNQRNSKKQGDVGLGVAIGWFSRCGNTVCIPLTDSQDFDLVVEIDGALRRVQIKTSRCQDKYGHYLIELRTKGGNRSGTGKTKKFNIETIDYLFVYTANDDSYLIPVGELGGVSQITLTSKYDSRKLG